MATPTPADDVVIKASTSDPANEEQAVQEDLLQEDLLQEEEGPARFPLSTQEQLQAMARRREAAVSFKNQVSECRLALRYSVIGWTGTLDPTNHAQEKIPTALSNAPSIRDLDAQMDKLERKLAPFLPADNSNNGGQGLGAEALARVERVRAALLEVEPGVKSTRFIKPVLDGVERGARASGILPPQDNVGWVWSLSFDDWFIWRAGEGAFVSARHGVRTDFVAA
ncbi:hypothetical protein INS49_002652 [Diaporthe citri]|uniref:uncharacterized protein n=1 Tax=Diaporthe citri TaxID=83186 RepID=UPI001C814C51|nr:uncharacterized protein INS49_002652 [Diaporthe citri]KAG6368445.1 hypothetical protein INS49_002652 [Diaporthe citri]